MKFILQLGMNVEQLIKGKNLLIQQPTYLHALISSNVDRKEANYDEAPNKPLLRQKYPSDRTYL